MDLTSSEQIQLIKDVSEIKQMCLDIKEQVFKTNGQVKINTAWIEQQKGIKEQRGKEMILLGISVAAISTIFASVIAVVIQHFWK